MQCTPVTGLRLTLLQIQRGVAGMSLTEPLGVTGVSLAMPLGVAGKREEELLQRQLSIVQQLLNQLHVFRSRIIDKHLWSGEQGCCDKTK